MLRTKKYRLIFGGLLLLLSQIAVGQENVQKQTSNVIDTIPFTLTSHNNISIKAIMGQKDTLDLMFHTAANGITLTKQATENMKSIVWDSQSEAGSWGGRAIMRYSADNSIQIGALNWEHIEVWEDENSGPTTDGKFGPNLFEGKIIEIDFDNNLLILYDTLPLKADDFEKMKLINKNDDFFIAGTSTIGGVDFENHYLIHSGYGGTLLYDDLFAEESNIGERIEIIEEKELRDSFGNVIKIKKGLLPLFSIGNISLTNVPVGFFQGKIGQQQMSIIGADVLKRFNLILDANRTYIYLRENQLQDMAYTQF